MPINLYTKVLIFGQPFNNFSGGGITLTNLFKGWPKDKIAVTYLGHGLINITTDVCDTYYQLGEEEHKWIFPFNLIQRRFPSGLKSFDEKTNGPVNSGQTGIRYGLVNRFFYPALHWLGLFHFATRISVSKRFEDWLSEFNPEVLYLQVATRDEIIFARELISYLRIPSVIHMMDDWPSTISGKGLFRNFWSAKIGREFKELLNQVDLHLSISDAMSDEYKKRYNKDFIAFHNPIEIEAWLPFIKTNFAIDKKYVTVLYSGRIGDNGIAESLVEVASAIDSINNARDNDSNIKLHIQTPTKKKDILNMLKKYRCVVFNPFAEYNQIPMIFSSADILLLANDFSPEGVNFLRFSMPTKASEYMISGTPVLVYTSGLAAVSKFFSQNHCGYCVTNQSMEDIVSAIKLLIADEEYRKELSRNAVHLAKDKFDSVMVRSRFQKLLINLKNKEYYVHR